MPYKRLLASKTFWLAVIQAAGGILIAVETEVGGLGGIIIGKSILDVFLRLLTDKPIK